MKRRVLALGAGLLLLGLVPGSTLAANPASLDQQNAVGSNQANDGGHLFAQTFTVGKTGMLSSVDLWLGGGGGLVTVSIEAVDGSHLPTGSALASGTGTAPTTPGWVNFPFSVPLSVTTGQMYAIVFTAAGPPYIYGSNSGTDTYTGGVAYFDISDVWTPMGNTEGLPPDLAFRTYVDPAATAAPSVVPGPTATPPPTSTAGGSSSAGDGAPIWFVPMGLLAAFCVLMVLAELRRRRPSI